MKLELIELLSLMMPSKCNWEAGPGKGISACEKCIDDGYFHAILDKIFSFVRNRLQFCHYEKLFICIKSYEF